MNTVRTTKITKTTKRDRGLPLSDCRRLLRGTSATTALVCGALLLQPIGAQGRKPAPGVTLQTTEGRTVQLTDYKGKVVLVDFWASWCVPCKVSFPALDTLYKEYNARGLEVLAVNVDERRRDAEAFLAPRPHAMPVFFDPKGVSPAAFAVKGMPSSFLIDRAGNIRFTHMGYSENIGRTYRQEIEQLLSER